VYQCDKLNVIKEYYFLNIIELLQQKRVILLIKSDTGHLLDDFFYQQIVTF